MLKTVFLILTIMLFAPIVNAQDAGVPSESESAPMSVAPLTEAQKVEAELQKVLHVDESASLEQLMNAGKKVYAQAKTAKQSKEATEIAIALSSALFLLLASLRRVLGADRLNGNKVRVACLVTGSLASLLGYYGGGYGAVESLQLFMAGIGSMAINETIKIAKPKTKEVEA